MAWNVVIAGGGFAGSTCAHDLERLKTVAEPSGACALAALLAGRVRAGRLRVGVTLSGGNVAPRRFAELLAE